MKLTKNKLEQLILEEMRYFRPPEFDSRLGKEHPQHANKLSTLYKQDPRQATSLADSLGVPIDLEIPETDQEPEKIPLAPEKMYNPRTNVETFGDGDEDWKYGTWYHYVMSRYSRYFESPIEEDAFERYVEYGEDHGHLSANATRSQVRNLRKKLEAERNDINAKYYIRPRTDSKRREEIYDLYGYTLRNPDNYK